MTICKNEGNCSVSEREIHNTTVKKTSPTEYLPEMKKPLQHSVFDNLSKASSAMATCHLPSD